VVGKTPFYKCKNLINVFTDFENWALKDHSGSFSDTLIPRVHPIFDSELSKDEIKKVYNELPVHKELYRSVCSKDLMKFNFGKEKFLAIDKESEMTVLHVYASLGLKRMELNVLQYLLDNVPKEYLEKKDKNDRLPLHNACILGVSDTKVLELLIPEKIGALKKGNNKDVAPLAVGIRHGVMSFDALVFLYSMQPISKLMVEGAKEEAKLNDIKNGYVELVKRECRNKDSFSSRKRHAWVDFISSHLEDDYQLTDELVSFLKNKKECNRETLFFLAHAKGYNGKDAMTVAISKIGRAFQSRLYKFGRYEIENEEHPVHKSKTCTVHFAIDTKKDSDDPHRKVAIKFMDNEEQFHRELNQRLQHRGSLKSGDDVLKHSNIFEEDHVVPLLRYHDEPMEYEKNRCIVMPRGERNLDDIIRNERIAGHDIDAIRFFAIDIAKALAHLHNKNIVHLDFKPRNIVRSHGRYKLIDFDASTNIGKPLTKKFSSGYIPPEAAKAKFRPEQNKNELIERQKRLQKEIEKLMSEGDFEVAKEKFSEISTVTEQLKRLDSPTPDDHLKANEQMDIWSYGVVFYQMVTTGDGLFRCDRDDNLINEQEQLKLANWKDISDEDLRNVLSKGDNQEYTESAKALLRCCLNADPKKRPASMNQILGHPFFKGRSAQLDSMKRDIINVVKKTHKETMKNQATIKENQDIFQKKQNMMKRDLKKMDKKVDRNLDRIIDKQDELKRSNENMQEQLEKYTRMIILANDAAPKYFFVVPQGLSFMDIVMDIVENDLGAVLLKKKAKLYFVCPVTLSVPRDSNGQPIGYDLDLERAWVEKVRPALVVSLWVLHMAALVARLGITYKIGDDKDFLSFAKQVNRKDLARSYTEVKIFAQEKDLEFLKSGLAKSVCHVDGSVEYVLNDPRIRALYTKEGTKCLHLSADERSRKGVDLHKILVEGELEKEPKTKTSKTNKWVLRYFVLFKTGLLTYYHKKDDRDKDIMGVNGKIEFIKVAKINRKDGDLIEVEDADKKTRVFNVPGVGRKDEWLDAGRNIL